MMYRPTPSAKSARNMLSIMAAAGTNAIVIAGEALKSAMVTMGIYEQAMRENRQRDRWSRRYARWSHGAQHNETPGCRAAQRRLRQNAHRNQMQSHKPGTVWPRHLGERDRYVLDAVLAS